MDGYPTLNDRLADLLKKRGIKRQNRTQFKLAVTLR